MILLSMLCYYLFKSEEGEKKNEREDYYDSLRRRVEVDYRQNSGRLAREEQYAVHNPKYGYIPRSDNYMPKSSEYSFLPKGTEYEPPYSHVYDLYEKVPNYVDVERNPKYIGAVI